MKSPTQVICLSGEIYVRGVGRTREVILTPHMQTTVEEGQDPIPPFAVDMDYLRGLLEEFRIGPFAAGPGSMTETIQSWRDGGGGPAGPGSMTDTIQTWRPDEFLQPPVLLEPPPGMAPPTPRPHVHTHPTAPSPGPGGPAGGGPAK